MIVEGVSVHTVVRVVSFSRSGKLEERFRLTRISLIITLHPKNVSHGDQDTSDVMISGAILIVFPILIDNLVRNLRVVWTTII